MSDNRSVMIEVLSSFSIVVTAYRLQDILQVNGEFRFRKVVSKGLQPNEFTKR